MNGRRGLDIPGFPPTQQEIDEWIRKVETMSHYGMAYLWRFAEPGHIVFRTDLPIYEKFKKRFNAFGGFTTKISKEVGWVDKEGKNE